MLGSQVWLERRKWPDAPHYGVLGTVLGEDDHGVWVGARPGNTVVDPDGTVRQGTYPMVWCLPRADWCMLHFLSGHPEVDVYIDICTPAVWNDRGARTVDLDFDVIVWKEPRAELVELVDEDEFEEHRVALGYPDDLVAKSRRAAADVLARTRAGHAPFTAAVARPWFEMLSWQSPGEGSQLLKAPTE